LLDASVESEGSQCINSYVCGYGADKGKDQHTLEKVKIVTVPMVMGLVNT